MSKQNKVAVNLAQDFNQDEQAQARKNIGAPNKPMVFDLGNNIYQSNPLLSGESNAVLQKLLGTIPNSIILYKDKTYLIQPSVFGTAEYTMQIDSSSARFSLEMYLIPDSGWIYANSIRIAEAQFNCNSIKGSNVAGYHFNVTIGSSSYLYTPSQDITFTEAMIVNNGNVLGTNNTKQARCFMDFNLGSLVITEI